MQPRKSAGPGFWPPIDRELYEKAARHGSRRSGQRRLRSLSSRYRRGLEVDYTVSQRWLQAIGRLHPDTLPVARWAGDTLEDMAIDMIASGYSVASVHSRIGRLKRMLKVMQPDAELGHFDALLREIERPRARFDPIVWKVSSADLQSYGVELMERADAIGSVAATEAPALYCCGLQIALIAARPWRKSQSR